MKMPFYLESREKVYGCLEELEIDPRTARACTPHCDITIEARMPHTGITMTMKLEVILGQQLAIQADRSLQILDKSCYPVTGG
jgi:hypothetical protein